MTAAVSSMLLVLIAGASLLIGVGGGFIGAYIGMRMGLVRLEEWRKSVDENINRLSAAYGKHNDDLDTFNEELGILCYKAGIPRSNRQKMR
jgi:hypothetical protein